MTDRVDNDDDIDPRYDERRFDDEPIDADDDGWATSDEATPADELRPPWPRPTEDAWRTIVRRGIVVVVLVVVAGGFWLAIRSAETGSDPVTFSGSSPLVTVLSPRNGDTVVNQQSQISLTVDIRYVATMSIGGVRIPDDQITRLPQANGTQLLFSPGQGKAVEAMPAGQNCVTITLARADGTPETQAPAVWCFRVA